MQRNTQKEEGKKYEEKRCVNFNSSFKGVSF